MAKRIYIDMDGVLCDFRSAYFQARQDHQEIEFPQSIPGIFENLEPIPGAIEAVEHLRSVADVYVLSAPSTRNPRCYMEKRIWIEKHFGYEFTKRLILATNKSLMIGDYLIDDFGSGKGQDGFQGELIHFGSEVFPDWRAVLEFLNEDTLNERPENTNDPRELAKRYARRFEKMSREQRRQTLVNAGIMTPDGAFTKPYLHLGHNLGGEQSVDSH